MRSILIGFFSGLLLSALRAPLGLELLQMPGTTAGAAMAYRAGALVVIALGLIFGLGRQTARFSPTQLIVGAALGYQLHWQLVDTPEALILQLIFSLLLVVLLVAGHRGGPDTRPQKSKIVLLALAALGGWLLLHNGYPESHAGALGTALVGVACLAIVGRLTGGNATEPEESERLPAGGLSGIAICGAGLAILTEGLARHLRLLGAGNLEDDSVFGSVFLGLTALGAISFARLFTSRKATILARGCLAGASGLAAWAAFRVIDNLASPRGLDLYVRSFERFGFNWDLSIHGLVEYDLVIAAPVLVVSAFIIGTSIGLHRRPIELCALLVGAGAGLVLSPGLLAFEWGGADGDTPALLSSSHSAAMALFGGLIAAAGSLLVFLTAYDLGKTRRVIGCVVAFGGVALCKFPEHEAIHILSPWERRETQAEWVLDSPAGLLTVEKDNAGELFATLDRRPISASTATVLEEQRWLYQSVQLLGERAEDEKPAVLFVGQLDPSRALFLADLGIGRIDRTASWHEAMGALEHHLFGGTPKWFPGEILSLVEARAALDRGEYDLVIIPPVSGDAPTTRNLASPENTTVVVWLDAGGGVESQHLGEHVLASVPGLTRLYLGVARGPRVEEIQLASESSMPTFLAAGDPIPGIPALEYLGTRKGRRRDLRQARMALRLADAERAPGLGAGLYAHFSAQTTSSPFESAEQSIELSDEAAKAFSEAAAAESPSRLAIELIETLAHLYRVQRKIEEIDQFLLRPAERHVPWPALELALAQASLEFLEPETALESLQRAHSEWPGSPESWAMQAEAEQQSGQDRAAADSLERARAMAPANHAIEKRLAIAWKRAGDPRGPEAIREALLEHPEDPELLAHQMDGPPPAPAPGFHPLVVHDHSDH